MRRLFHKEVRQQWRHLRLSGDPEGKEILDDPIVEAAILHGNCDGYHEEAYGDPAGAFVIDQLSVNTFKGWTKKCKEISDFHYEWSYYVWLAWKTMRKSKNMHVYRRTASSATPCNDCEVHWTK